MIACTAVSTWPPNWGIDWCKHLWNVSKWYLAAPPFESWGWGAGFSNLTTSRALQGAMDLRPELVGLKHVRFSHVISMNFLVLFRVEMCSTLMLCPLTFLMTLSDHGPTGRSLLKALLALEWQYLCVSLALTKRRIKFLWQCLLAPCMQAAKDWFEVRLDDLEMKYLRNLEKRVQKSWRMLPSPILVKAEW